MMNSKEETLLNGMKYLNTNDLDNFNPTKAFEYYTKLAETGVEFSKVVLGAILYIGMGEIEQDIDKANSYFSQIEKYQNLDINSWIIDFKASCGKDSFYNSLFALARNYK